MLIQKLLAGYSTNTKITYKQALKLFFKTIFGKDGDLNYLLNIYFSEKRNYMEDINLFLEELSKASPSKQRTYLAAIKTIFLYNGVELPQAFWKSIAKRLARGRAYEDYIPKIEDIKKLLFHSRLIDRALILTLLSTGARIGEILQVKLSDIDLDSSPARIYIRREYTKSKEARTVFLTDEARNILVEWIKQRPLYLEAKKKKFYTKNVVNDDRLFPIAYHCLMASVWPYLIKRAGIDTGGKNFRPHSFRKFFRTYLVGHGCNVDIVEVLMGHRGYLTEAYRKYSEEELATYYKEKIEPLLTIFGNAQQLIELKQNFGERLKRLEDENKRLREENMELRQELLEMKVQLQELTSKLENARLLKLLEKNVR